MNWYVAAQDRDLPEGEVKGVTIAGVNVAIYRLDGVVYATNNICSHEFAFLSDGFLENGYIECPLHAARFDVKTGAALCAPATEGVATYPVKIDGGAILVELPESK